MNAPHSATSSSAPHLSLKQQLQDGYTLLRQGRAAKAIELGRQLMAARPTDAHISVFCAEASLANEDFPAALAFSDEAILAEPDNPALRVRKANLLLMMRHRAEIPAVLGQIGNHADGRIQMEIGKIFRLLGRMDEAIVHFEKARAVLGAVPVLLYETAAARFFNGNFDGAEKDLDTLLTLEQPFGKGNALYLRATLRRQTRTNNHLDDISQHLQAGFAHQEEEAAALYAQSKELEDLGEHEKSFDALVAAAAKRRATLTYDIENELAAQRAIREVYNTGFMAQPYAGNEGEGAIFIVGLPRSGTTLTERILTQSGQIRSAGELMDFSNLLGDATNRVLRDKPGLPAALASSQIDFAALGREYMRGAREAANGSPMFIDKMPINYIYCGIISKALPKARIIHLTRDPLDNCYAMYKTLFYNSYHFSYDLRELGDYYALYRDTMRHWHEVMPGQILDLSYEELVGDTGSAARRLAAWCGLEWSPRLLETPGDDHAFATASAAQVREPVHDRSLKSSRRHLQRLSPLVERLTTAGIAIDA